MVDDTLCSNMHRFGVGTRVPNNVNRLCCFLEMCVGRYSTATPKDKGNIPGIFLRST